MTSRAPEEIKALCVQIIEANNRYTTAMELSHEIGITPAQLAKAIGSNEELNWSLGYGRPNFSAFAEKIWAILKKHFPLVQRERKFPDLRSPKNRPLKYDFCIPSKSLLLAADGPQHRYAAEGAPKFGYWEKDMLENLRICDELKNEYAAANSYILVRVPYGPVKEEEILARIEAALEGKEFEPSTIPPEEKEVHIKTIGALLLANLTTIGTASESTIAAHPYKRTEKGQGKPQEEPCKICGVKYKNHPPNPNLEVSKEKLPPELVAEIRADLLKGIPCIEIASQRGLGFNRVRTIARNEGIPVAVDNHQIAQENQRMIPLIEEMLEQGYERIQILQTLNEESHREWNKYRLNHVIHKFGLSDVRLEIEKIYVADHDFVKAGKDGKPTSRGGRPNALDICLSCGKINADHYVTRKKQQTTEEKK